MLPLRLVVMHQYASHCIKYNVHVVGGGKKNEKKGGGADLKPLCYAVKRTLVYAFPLGQNPLSDLEPNFHIFERVVLC
jgi:hypothetical protein